MFEGLIREIHETFTKDKNSLLSEIEFLSKAKIND